MAASHAHKRPWTKTQARLLGTAVAAGAMAVINSLLAIPEYYMTRNCSVNPAEGSVCTNSNIYPEASMAIALPAATIVIVVLSLYAASRWRSRGVHRRFGSESARQAAIKAQKESRDQSRDEDPKEIMWEQFNELLGMQIKHLSGGLNTTGRSIHSVTLPDATSKRRSGEQEVDLVKSGPLDGPDRLADP